MGKEAHTAISLAEKVKQGKIGLPEMQRSYVWNDKKICKLLDSMYRGYITGTILLWEKPDIDIKERDFAFDKQSEGIQQYLLLDGQQRLTSLLAVFEGDEMPLLKKGKMKKVDILFNLNHPLEARESGENDESDDTDLVEQEIFAVSNSKLKKQPHWVSVTEVLKSTAEAPFLEKCGIEGFSDPLFDEYSKKLQRLRSIKSYEYDVYTLGSDLPYEDVNQIFVRVNSEGARLKSSDLALAQITLKWSGALEKFENFKESCKEKGFSHDIGIFVRNLVVLLTGQCRFKEIDKIPRKDFERGWEESKRCFSAAIDFIKDIGIEHSYFLLNEYLIITVGYFLKKKDFKLSKEEKGFLCYWFLIANAKGRYSGSSESDLDQDLKSIKSDDKDSLRRMVRDLESKVGRLNIEVVDFSNRRTPYIKTMFAIFRKSGARDWNTRNTISLDFLSDKNKIELHHIFPKAKLKDKYPPEAIDDIANMTFVSMATNRGIRDDLPENYLLEIIENAGKEFLRDHCIPTDKSLWKLKNYEKFLEERRELIAQKMNDFIGDNPFKS